MSSGCGQGAVDYYNYFELYFVTDKWRNYIKVC